MGMHDTALRLKGRRATVKLLPYDSASKAISSWPGWRNGRTTSVESSRSCSILGLDGQRRLLEYQIRLVRAGRASSATRNRIHQPHWSAGRGADSYAYWGTTGASFR